MTLITEAEYKILNGWTTHKIEKILKKYGLTITTAEVVDHKMTDGSHRYYVRKIK